ncbi:MAG: hypothetical protein E7L17_06010 [Clostridium sp.]|uniref:hypothetical protein n=1 Tax=Clostridium sp. TaxID=1506 RepID=UPI00290F83CD|nr:hypothetical protein [Clostridium sp.]MDU7337653.1 hypothetical protein [Clostridium sp.]
MSKAEYFTVATSIRFTGEVELPWAKSVVALTKESGEYQCTCNGTKFYIEQNQRDEYEQTIRQHISEQLSVHFSEICCSFTAQTEKSKEEKNTALISECGETNNI